MNRLTLEDCPASKFQPFGLRIKGCLSIALWRPITRVGLRDKSTSAAIIDDNDSS